jgi:hypothetical protein
MIPSFRSAFNSNYKPEKYGALLRTLETRCGVPIGFRVSETPCFLPQGLVERLAEDGKELIRQLVDSPEYHERSSASIPPKFCVSREDAHPTFVQVDFGLVRDPAGELQPKLVELQAFPSLYAYQPILAESYRDVFELDSMPGRDALATAGPTRPDSGRTPRLCYFLSGLDRQSYRELLRQAIVGGHDPKNVILMEFDPLHQKTLPDFLATEKLLGIRTVDIRAVKKDGNRLFYQDSGRQVPIRRIYNRAIVDELERKGAQLNFDFRDDLQVEWAGHPNWYFRISKFAIPYLQHPSVPQTWFLDQMERVPEDLENYALKPLYSFAGMGVVIAPKKEDILALPWERKAGYILQERLHFAPVIETPHGGTKVEVRVMYVWVDELTPVLTILRMGRGLMMGVDHNRNMEWVGSSAGFF